MNIQGMTPLMAAPLQAQATNSNSTSGTGSSSSTSSSTSSSSLQSTFLSLLATELQNQDPTQPVDPTQMVGEMISLNQLDQLININQTLSGLMGTPTGSSSSTTASANSTAAAQSNHSSLLPPTTGRTVLGADKSLLPLSPTASPGMTTRTMQANPGVPDAAALSPAAWMNLYGNIGAPANATNKFNTVGGR